MGKWASTSAKTVLLAAGFVALGSGVALADSEPATSGNGSLLGGNQAVVNGDVPVNVTGNAISAVAGVAGASSTDSNAEVVDHQSNEVHTSGNGSALGGNQLVVDGDVPVNVTGNAISAVAGVAGASSTDNDSEVLHEAGHGHGHEDVVTSGNGSLLGGNQLVGDLDVPVNVSGNAIGAVGGVAGAAATDADAIVRDHQSAPVEHQAGRFTATDLVNEAAENVHILPDTSGVDAGVLRQSAPVREHQSIATSGNGSALGGNQLVADADVPVNVAGNAVSAVAGIAGASATDVESEVEEVEQDIATSGNGSLAGGNQLVADADVPVNVAGNAVSAVAGVAGASATDVESEVEHQSAETEAQASALDSAPVVDQLPEVPVSEMLPVDYSLSETADQGVVDQASAELPEATEVPEVDPVGDLLGAAGAGL